MAQPLQLDRAFRELTGQTTPELAHHEDVQKVMRQVNRDAAKIASGLARNLLNQPRRGTPMDRFLSKLPFDSPIKQMLRNEWTPIRSYRSINGKKLWFEIVQSDVQFFEGQRMTPGDILAEATATAIVQNAQDFLQVVVEDMFRRPGKAQFDVEGMKR